MKIAKRTLAFLMVAIMAFSATVVAYAEEKATSLKLNAATINWIVGKSGSFKATVTPSGASETFKWTSSKPAVATVSSEGKLTAKSIGTAIITCSTTDGSNLKATCKVTVGKAVTSLKLNKDTINWTVGKSGSFKATVSPSDAINKSLSWSSSDPDVATITQSGKLTAVSEGVAIITCKTKDGSELEDTCKVTVGKEVASVKLNAGTIKWPVGKTGYFKATVSPSDAINDSLLWSSSNSKVAAITQSGKLTAVSVGTAVITCKAKDGSGKYATCKVTVGKAVAAVKLNTSTINWTVGKTGSFKATVSPSNAVNKSLLWTSSDPDVATITQNGKLTAVSEGTAIITCKAKDGSGKYATCKVTVGKEITSVKLNASTIRWSIGKTGYFKATISPSDAVNKSLLWTSSNPRVATVTQSGKLTAVAAGTTIITCKAKDGSGEYDTCKVIVLPRAKTLKLNAATIKWTEGRSGTFKPAITPSNASTDLLWTSSNPKVATITQDGKLTAIKAGTATITCKTKDGSNLISTCKVTVVKSYLVAENYKKLYEDYFDMGVFTIEGRLTTTDGREKIELPFSIAKNGKKHYIRAEYTYMGFTAQLLVNNSITYIVIPAFRSYQKIEEDVFANAGFEGLTDTKEYVESETVKINGLNYVREELVADDGSRTYFYFLDGELKIIKFKTDGGESNFYVDSIKNTVNSSDYKVPSGYKELA